MDSTKIFLSILTSILEIIFGFIFFYLFRIYFDIEIVGYFGAISSFIMAFSFISELGFGIAHLKYYSEANNSEEEAICNGTFLFFRLIQLSIYIGLMFILIPIIPVYEKDILVIYFIFLGNLFLKSGTFFKPIFMSKKQVIKNSLPATISSFIKILLLITITIIFNNDIWLLANILFITNLIYFMINLYFFKDLKIKRSTFEYRKKYLKFSLPFFAITSLTIFFYNIDVLMINSWFSIEQVANFFTAKQIYNYIIILTVSTSQLLITTFSKNIYLKNNEKNLLIIKKTHKFLNLFAVPFVFLIALYSTEIITFTFGENYGLTGIILSILAFHLIFFSTDFANANQLKALGKVNFLAKFSFLKILIAIILMLIFISPYFLNMGSIGGALSFVLTEVILQLIYRPIIYKKYNLGFYWGSFRNLAIMLAIFILQLFVNELFIYPKFFIPFFVILDLGLYFFINYLFKGFSKEDFKFILKVINIRNIKDQILLELKEL